MVHNVQTVWLWAEAHWIPNVLYILRPIIYSLKRSEERKDKTQCVVRWNGTLWDLAQLNCSRRCHLHRTWHTCYSNHGRQDQGQINRRDAKQQSRWFPHKSSGKTRVDGPSRARWSEAVVGYVDWSRPAAPQQVWSLFYLCFQSIEELLPLLPVSRYNFLFPHLFQWHTSHFLSFYPYFSLSLCSEAFRMVPVWQWLIWAEVYQGGL